MTRPLTLALLSALVWGAAVVVLLLLTFAALGFPAADFPDADFPDAAAAAACAPAAPASPAAAAAAVVAVSVRGVATATVQKARPEAFAQPRCAPRKPDSGGSVSTPSLL
eukprot:365764-Chlamydomonas_euryale.AAC.9